MKKNKSLIMFLLMMFFALFMCSDAVKAFTLDVSGSSESEKVMGSDFGIASSTMHFYLKKHPDTGKYEIYCADSSKGWFNSGTKTFNCSEQANSKIAYILANGYPHKSLTDNYKKDYLITGLSVYYVLNKNDVILNGFQLDLNNYSNSKYTYNSTANDLAIKMAELVSGAEKYASNSNLSIAVKLADKGFTLSSDKKYYVSKPISVTTTGVIDNYTVSVSNGPTDTFITDVNGNSKTTFSKTDSFLVKIPFESINGSSASVTIDVSANGNIYKAYKCAAPSNDSALVQSVFVGEQETKSVSASLELTTSKTIEISKQDATTGKELPGATLILKDANGNTKDDWKWVSGDTPHKIEGLEPGKYTLTETIAPAGYKKSSETVEFTVESDGTVKDPVVMKNYPTVVEISKQDVTTEKELPGASLEVKDENGKVVAAWISGDTPHKIEGLEPGKYYLTEVLAPDGYELSKETIEFVVNEDGTVDEMVVMYNEIVSPPTGDFLIYIAWIIGIGAIGYSIYYFRSLKKKN